MVLMLEEIVVEFVAIAAPIVALACLIYLHRSDVPGEARAAPSRGGAPARLGSRTGRPSGGCAQPPCRRRHHLRFAPRPDHAGTMGDFASLLLILVFFVAAIAYARFAPRL